MRLVESIYRNLKEEVDLQLTSPLKLNTGVLPILDTNTYGRIDDWGAEEWDEEKGDWQDGYEPYPFENIKDSMITYGQPILEEYIQKVLPGATVKVTDLWSPKYYNFQGDELEFTVDFDVAKFNELAKQAVENPEFKDFLKENYKSYDGFTSFLADNLDEFWQQDGWKRFVQVVMFNLRDEDFEDANERFWEDVYTNSF